MKNIFNPSIKDLLFLNFVLLAVLLVAQFNSCGDFDENDLNKFNASLYAQDYTYAMADGTKEKSYFVYGDWVDDILEKRCKGDDCPKAITLGAHILVKREVFSWPRCNQVALFAHESKHVEDNIEKGTANASIDYSREYIQLRILGMSDEEALHKGKAEEEAYNYQKEVFNACSRAS